MFWLILIVPVIAGILMATYIKKNNSHIEWWAYPALVLCGVIVCVLGYFAYLKMNFYDVEILSGKVTGKSQDWTSCEHSYQCNPRKVRSCSGSGKDKRCSTTTEYDTCYEHTNDWDWNVSTTVGTVTIARVDRRGSRTPPRWAKVLVGEPAAREHAYMNYVKGSESSLFGNKHRAVEYDDIPKYPEVYDYYRVNRVINMTTVDTRGWADYLSDELRTLGKEKQLNIVTILTNHPVSWSDSLFAKWGGGKKNDVVMVYGVSPEGTVSWFRSTSFADGMNNQALHIRLRNESTDQKINLDLLKQQVDTIKTEYTRLEMKEFEYLKYSVSVPFWWVFITMVLSVGAIYGLGIALVNYRSYNRYYR